MTPLYLFIIVNNLFILLLNILTNVFNYDVNTSMDDYSTDIKCTT
jgi:hypothetical protein